jgi:endonuclease YncB( thermonuclease family)
MKIKQIVIIIFCVLLSSRLYSNAVTKVGGIKIPVKLTKIVDGDTVNVKINDNEFPVRLVGIDCFESSDNNRAYKQAYVNKITVGEVISKGKKSTEYLNYLHKKSNNQVFLDFRGLDKYKRVLGIIYFGDDNINEIMHSNGGCMKYVYAKNNSKN